MKALLLLTALFVVSNASADIAPSGEGHVMVSAKDLKWSSAPAGLPPGAEAAMIDGDPTKAGEFTMRLRFPANYKIAPHFHPKDEHVTVLEGAFSMGMGEKMDPKSAHAMSVGDFARMSAGTRHFAMASAPTIIQLHGTGPWGITYVNPADDPRKSKR